jgi:glycerol kinase
MKVFLALDAGTTNVKAILVDHQANVLARSSVPLTIDFPKRGWVEQSAKEVWDAARQALEGCLAQGAEHEVVALGISNQRETLVARNRGRGQAVAPCIVWQCRRSAQICQTLRQRAEAGGLCLGTVDAWLVWNLTGGKRYVTDFSNASRTQLFNLAESVWDPELLAPHWDEKARGAIVGLSFGTRKEHLVRAALEAIAFQVKDVFDAMQRAVGAQLEASVKAYGQIL